MDDEAVEQAEMMFDAIEKSGRPRKMIAGDMGVPYRTFDSWLRGERRLPISKLGLLIRALGDKWLADRILAPASLIAVPKVRAGDESFESIKDSLNRAMNRVTNALGDAAGSVADATDPENKSLGLSPIEAATIKSHLYDVVGLCNEVISRINEEQTPDAN